MFVDVFCVAALTLCCSRLSVALHLSHGRPPARSPQSQSTPFQQQHPQSLIPPLTMYRALWMTYLQRCVKVLVTMMNSQTPVCISLESARHLNAHQSYCSLLRKHGETIGMDWRFCLQLEHVLISPSVILAEENERGALLLTFDLPQSPLLKPNPVLLLVFESPLTGGNLDVTFTSQSLHPNTQSVCISEKTQYIMLTGKASEGGVHHRWRMSIETKKPDMSKK
ncbi:hypothetical protein F7725_027500 [Dissostichus mawsoni]|uniref:Anti-Mullerian hormone N-terminal domain-containing protein n=1 Tax=Dissostichus mawsoni TaxID=36200 RepID=A0A7J5XD27_DISMA|nr:hypothetical protein F7725_027500 [Dissostichus mawsoni]